MALKEAIQEKYGAAARKAATGASCCAPSCCDPITKDLYDGVQAADVPAAALAASLGCGNPTALAQLAPGGKAYGLDMTDDMLALANENKAKAGVANVEFLKGEIENIPLPENHVDVVISNCVINLSADKDRVLRETFRVLKPGGRFAVSDVVVRGEVPAEVRKSMELWIGCIAGALGEDEYEAKLAAAGFTEISVEPTRVYKVEQAREFLEGAGLEVDALAPVIDGKFASAFIRARKPA